MQPPKYIKENLKFGAILFLIVAVVYDIKELFLFLVA